MTTRQGDGTPGGYRKPTRPAAVSVPQSGARTDGGAGDSQPIRTPTGGAYGESKALTEQQQGAPLAAGGPTPQGVGPAGQGGGASAQGGVSPGLFGPTNRPSEAITAGAPAAPGGQMLTSDELLRVLYNKRPSPYLARLLRDN